MPVIDFVCSAKRKDHRIKSNMKGGNKANYSVPLQCNLYMYAEYSIEVESLDLSYTGLCLEQGSPVQL